VTLKKVKKANIHIVNENRGINMNIKRILEKIRKNWHYLLFMVVLVILNYYFLYDNIIQKIETPLFIGIIFIFIFLVEVILGYLIRKMLDKGKPLEQIFLTIAIPLGVLYMLVFPMAGTPDELAHYYRSYEISMGHVTSQFKDGLGGREMPRAVSQIFENLVDDTAHIKYEEIIDTLKIKTDPNDKVFIDFSTSALYSPLCYLPQAIGIGVGRILHLPTTLTFYTGRLANFACFLMIIYFALKYMPIKKNSFLCLLLLPIVFQAAVSLSPDALTIAVALSLISFVLYMKYTKKGLMTNKEFALMGVLCVFMSMLKIVYLPICFLIFLIPKERFKNNKERYIKTISILLVAILINLVWLVYSSKFLIESNPGVNSGEQVKFILTHPISYLKILMDTLTDNYLTYVMTGMGSSLGWLAIYINQSYLFLYLILIIFVVVTDQDKKKKLKEGEKWWIALLTIGVIVLIFTSLYVQWNPVGNSMINGVQGRYFMPVALMGILLIGNKVKFDLNKRMNYITTFIIFFNVYIIIECLLFHLN
jgi:predicted membrane protein